MFANGRPIWTRLAVTLLWNDNDGVYYHVQNVINNGDEMTLEHYGMCIAFELLTYLTGCGTIAQSYG